MTDQSIPQIELFSDEQPPRFEEAYCPMCGKASTFVSTFSPRNFWVCTHCPFRTSTLMPVHTSIEDDIIQRRFELPLNILDNKVIINQDKGGTHKSHNELPRRT